MKRTGKTNRRLMALLLAVACCAGAMQIPQKQVPAKASTIAELEAKKAENNKKIEELENQLAQYEADQKEAEAYQATLQTKIDALQSNMEILDTELETIKENIFDLEGDIADMEDTIEQQEKDIDKGMEEFKLRLRAMYVNGNDSLASALVGATDFYDLLSKYELISCVARHDDELVNTLKTQLESYNQNLKTLETQKTQEEQAKAEKETKQEEMKASMTELQDAFAESKAEKERLAIEADAANKSIDELNKENKAADAAEQDIYAQIQRAQEEARRKAEEARKAAEEAAKQQQTTEAPQAEGTNNSNTSGQDSAPVQQETTAPAPEPSYANSSFSWPCPGHYYISSGYGSRWGRTHRGIDIAQNQGAAVVASRSGTVIKSYTGCVHNYGKSGNCCGNGYGNYVIIMHDDGTYSTLYGHLASVSVSVGSYVSKGQTIGYVGSTGSSTGFHLHFEIRQNGTAVNPSSYLNF